MRSVIASILFIAITIVLSIISIPAAVLDRSGRSYLALARFWSKCFLWLFNIKVEVSGLEKLIPNRPTVYVANHSSYVDIPVILAAIPDQIRLILRDSLTRIPIWGWALKVSPFIVISRSNAIKARETLETAANVIHSGAAVLLFPEGTRTHDGAMQPFKRGAFKLALESEASVVPIAIEGTFDILPRSKQLPVTGRMVKLHIASPISYAPSLGDSRRAEMELMKRAEEAVREILAK